MSEQKIEAIEAGVRVVVRTTNGGEVEGTLSHRYVTTYPLYLEEMPQGISGWRVKSVEVVR